MHDDGNNVSKNVQGKWRNTTDRTFPETHSKSVEIGWVALLASFVSFDSLDPEVNQPLESYKAYLHISIDIPQSSLRDDDNIL